MYISQIKREMEEGKYSCYEIPTSSMSKAEITNLIVSIKANNLRIISDLSKVGGSITIVPPLKLKDIIEHSINDCKMYGCSEIDISNFTSEDYTNFMEKLSVSNLKIYERNGSKIIVAPKERRQNINTREVIRDARNDCKMYGCAEISISSLSKEQIELIKAQLKIYGLKITSEDINKLTVLQDEKEKSSHIGNEEQPEMD